MLLAMNRLRNVDSKVFVGYVRSYHEIVFNFTVLFERGKYFEGTQKSET